MEREFGEERRHGRPRWGALSIAFLVIGLFALIGGAIVIAEPLIGSSDGEKLVGTPNVDRILGEGGADYISGRQGNDRLFGGYGGDIVRGAKGTDRLKGGPGDDRLIAGKGDDWMYGGPGRDQFNTDEGVQLGAPGDNRINARDSELDEINCGDGKDVAIVDRAEDGVFGCEVLKVPKP